MPRYQFITGVSLVALEEELNRVTSNEPSLELKQVFYAQGTGFVALIEHSESVVVEPTKPPEKTEMSGKNQRRPQKKS